MLTDNGGPSQLEHFLQENAKLRRENERLRGALDRAARTLRGETGCEDQGQAYDTAQRIIDAALAGERA